MKERRAAFFIMPGNALKSLRDELQIDLGEAEARAMLERYGYRCGEEMAGRMELSCKDLKSLASTLEALWVEIGLGRPSVTHVLKEELIIKFEDSEELLALGYCDFIKGYLNGIADKILNRKFYCFEEECILKGAKHCQYRLVLTTEYLKPAPEKVSKVKPKYELEKGSTYLLKEEAPVKSYDIFVDSVTHGGEGLLITRDFPEKVRTRYKLLKTPILWLTNVEKEYAVNPVELSKLYYELVSFLKKGKNTIVLLSGLEYLVAQNGFKSVLKFLQLVRDQIAIYNSLLLLPLSPLTITKRDLKFIESELKVLE